MKLNAKGFTFLEIIAVVFLSGLLFAAVDKGVQPTIDGVKQVVHLK